MPDVPTVGSVWGVPGKPETWRLVESVNAAAVFWRHFRHTSGNDPFADWDEWLRDTGAIDLTAALASAAPQVQGETVRVRACVGRDDRGDYYVYGRRARLDSDEQLAADVRSADYDPVCFIEADIPRRTFPTVAARVVEVREIVK